MCTTTVSLVNARRRMWWHPHRYGFGWFRARETARETRENSKSGTTNVVPPAVGSTKLFRRRPWYETTRRRSSYYYLQPLFVRCCPKLIKQSAEYIRILYVLRTHVRHVNRLLHPGYATRDVYDEPFSVVFWSFPSPWSTAAAPHLFCSDFIRDRKKKNNETHVTKRPIVSARRFRPSTARDEYIN